MIRIYFDQRELILTTEWRKDSSLNGEIIHLFKNSEILRDLVLYFSDSESIPRLVILGSDIQEILNLLFDNFNRIDAAGGVVFNQNDKFLGIFRRGYWDLPKGKCEKGETVSETALREVEEECGISPLKIVNELDSTYHTYWLKDKLIIKKTWWFKMSYAGNKIPTPQITEDITEARWFSTDEKDAFLTKSFSSIKDVIKKLF